MSAQPAFHDTTTSEAIDAIWKHREGLDDAPLLAALAENPELITDAAIVALLKSTGDENDRGLADSIVKDSPLEATFSRSADAITELTFAGALVVLAIERRQSAAAVSAASTDPGEAGTPEPSTLNQ